MDKDFYIKLTFAVHKVADLFPQNEPLGSQIKNLANEILAKLVLITENSPKENSPLEPWVLDGIENLEGFFELAGKRGWVDGRNFLVLKKEYDKIKREIKKTDLSQFPRLYDKPEEVASNLRQKRILTILQERGKVKVGDLIKTFPQLSRRTLLRDLENLVHLGVTERNGNGRGVYYCPRNATFK